jgi:hypothetical protein
MYIEMSTTNKNDPKENTFELDIMTNMVNLSDQCISFLDKLQMNRIKIIQDIKNNENNFFDKNPDILSQFNSLFDPTIFRSKILIFSEEIEDTIDSYCCHEYIEDLIDIEYDKSKRIVYCQLCELTKK